jgi:sec-independent protein translocase protein TatA
MPNLGPTELIIILLIVVVIFGASRVTDIMGALGRGVGEFRRGTTEAPEPKKEEPTKAEEPVKSGEAPKNG